MRSPRADPFSMHPSSPINIFFTMAIAAYSLRLVEAYFFPSAVHQSIAIRRAMTIETPHSPTPMLQFERILDDVLVHRQQPWFFVLRVRHDLPVVASFAAIRAYIKIVQMRLSGFHKRIAKIAVSFIFDFRHVSHWNRAFKWIAVP
jgi:hypothetical protein